MLNSFSILVVVLSGPPTPPELPDIGPKNMPPTEETRTEASLQEIRETRASQQASQEALVAAEAAVLEMDIFLDPLLLKLAKAHLDAYKLNLKPEHLEEALAALERIQEPGPEVKKLLTEVRAKVTPGLNPFEKFVRDFLLMPELDPFQRCPRN